MSTLMLLLACLSAPAPDAATARLLADDGLLPPLSTPIAAGGDLDGGGFDDLVTVERDPGGWRVEARPGSPTGPSAAPVWSAVVPSVGSGAWPNLLLCDLQGDGAQDILLLEPDATAITWWAGGPAGLADRAPLSLPSELDRFGRSRPPVLQAIACADVNDDGADDVVATVSAWCMDTCKAGIGVWAGTPAGRTPVAPFFLESPSTDDIDDLRSAPIPLGNIHRDGRAEVALWRDGRVDVYAFTARDDYAAEPWASAGGARPVGDLDHDGLVDLVQDCPGAGGQAEPRLRDGAAAILDPCGGPAFDLFPVGDLNGDGQDDFAHLDLMSNTLTAYRGVRRAPYYDPLGYDLTRLIGAPDLAQIEGIVPVGDLWGGGHEALLFAHDSGTPGNPTRLLVDLPDDDGDGVVAAMDCNDHNRRARRGDVAWADEDGDGLGNPWRPHLVCGPPPAGWVFNADDCDDLAPPGVEIPNDGRDNDCDGEALCDVDADGDGFPGAITAQAPLASCPPPGTVADCDDTDPTRQPIDEVVDDGIDGACDGLVFCYADEDGDGRRAPLVSWLSHPCGADTRPSTAPEDCDDHDPAQGGAELPLNDVDEDCDGRLVCPKDADNDGLWAPSLPANVTTCVGFDPSVRTPLSEDCDDDRRGRGAPRPWFQDQDRDGYGVAAYDAQGAPIAPATVISCWQPPGYVAVDGDCDDHAYTTYPGAPGALDSAADRDCDGVYVTPWDGDGDGVGGWLVQSGTGPTWSPGRDCDDSDPLRIHTPVFGLPPGFGGCGTDFLGWLGAYNGEVLLAHMLPLSAVTLYAAPYAAGTELGLGPCLPGLGGGCLPLVGAVPVATGWTDADGSWTTMIPPTRQRLIAVIEEPEIWVSNFVLMY